jgi:glucose-6-phosphate isomerase
MVELDCTLLDLPANLAEQYAPQVRAALAQMADVEAGKIVNVDEKRMVGHYWLRAPKLAPPTEGKAIVAAQEHVEQFTAEARKRFNCYLLVGIGGSALGPQFLANAFREPGRTPSIYFFDNTDPEGFTRTLRDITLTCGLAKTLTIVVSKSGGTPETRNGMLVAQRAYQDAGLDFAKHAATVTEPGSHLEKLAAGWLARFPIWDWVGGRTSLFSPVGLLPAALLGFDWRGLLKGAAEMDERTRPTRGDPKQNPSLQLALAWYHQTERRGISHMVVLPYADKLALLASYLQQLVMESLGKDGKGISVFGNKGSTDQHSYVQQLRDGRPDFFAAFVRLLHPQTDPVAMIEVEPGFTSADFLAAFQEGTAKALHDAGRGSLRLSIDRVSEENVGGIIALFERAVGYYAAMIGINAYNQPGVEAGKKAAKEILAAKKK